jgi:hypothetical protein
MAGIFISYRRGSTAAFAGRLFDRLSTQFGKDKTFMDVDGIEPGEDFVEVLENRLTDAVAMVVLIGPDWLHVKDARDRNRLDNPDDFVRLEVATALRRKVRVIPVLMDDAHMPTAEELPSDLALLSRRQAIAISHARFHQDTAELITVLEKQLVARDGPANAGQAEEARWKARAEQLTREAQRVPQTSESQRQKTWEEKGREAENSKSRAKKSKKAVAYSLLGAFLFFVMCFGLSTDDEDKGSTAAVLFLITIALFWAAYRNWSGVSTPIEGMSLLQVNQELAQGGRFVSFKYCISFVVVTLRRSSKIVLIRRGESAFVRALPYAGITFLLGWWGIPFGPVFSIQSLYSCCRGGDDVTVKLMSRLDPQGQSLR